MRSILGIRIAVVALVCAPLVCAPLGASAATYYVNNQSSSCSNSGSGSLTTPYCTISAALSAHHTAGTTIIVLPGIYHEQVTLPGSGSSGSPIVLRGQGSSGNPVVVDGAADLGNPSLWVQYSGNVYRCASVNSSPAQVFVDDARLTASTASPGSIPSNSYEYVSGAGLYANVGGGNPGTFHAEASNQSFGFDVAGAAWVTIDGFTIKHNDWAGVQITNSNNVVVTNNISRLSGHYGIEAEGSQTILIGSNVCSENLWSGIGLTSSSTSCTVQDNETHHNVTPNQSSGIYLFGAPGNTIQRNRTHDNAYNGIMMSTGATNNLLRQNRSWNNQHQGIEDIFCPGNYHVGDVAYGNSWNGFAVEGGATGTTLYDCVAVDNSRSAGNADMEVDPQSVSGFVASDNLWWNSTSGPTVVKFNGVNYTSVAAYQAATGNDARTLQADPRWVNSAGGDFRPAAGSPLIDSGNSGVANWPSTDAVGNARVDDPATPNTGRGSITYADRGALEFQPSGAVNQPPVARLALSPTRGVVPLLINANGSGSSDPEGGRIASYRFDFGDGTVVGPQPGATAAHTYSAAGQFVVTLTVADSVGATGTATARDTVLSPANQPPVARLVLSPTRGLVPLLVNANGSGSSDPEGGRIASYRFDFGDGAVVGPQPGATAAHTYSSAGQFVVTLTVADSVGATGTATARDTVLSPTNQPPVAGLVLSPTSGPAPLAVTANGSGSSDPEGGRIASYRFDFGDGTVVGPQPVATAAHTYSAAGQFVVTLTVADSVGATGTATARDTVLTPQILPPVASLKVTPSSGFAVLNVTASGSGSKPGTSPIVSYTFNFGDGTVVGPQPGTTATHDYAAGNWTTTLTVTDANSLTATASVPVTVSPPPPPGIGWIVDNTSGTCSPTGPGTPASPFCTITAALNAHHNPGDSIFVMPGIYREQVRLPGSGSAGNPVVLQARGGDGTPVIVDGAEDFANPSLWTLFSGGIWLAPSVTWSPKQVFADSVLLAASTALPAALPVNSFTYVAGAGLYVNIGDNPGNHHAEVGHFAYGFYTTGQSSVTIDGFTVTRSEQVGIEITNSSSDVTATHNVVTWAQQYGIQVNGSNTATIGWNKCSFNYSSGIAVTAGCNACMVANNESFRNRTTSLACGIYSYGSSGNTYQGNLLHDNAYTGLRLTSAANSNVSLQNVSWNNARHGFNDIGCQGNTHVGDVAYGNVGNGFGIDGGATGTSVFDCVAVENNTGGGGADLEVDAASTAGFTSSDNLFWNSDATRPVVKWAGVSYTTLAPYQALSLQDARTLQANPMFADVTTGDFHPAGGSPLIDSGNSGVPDWPTTDAFGGARFDDPATANTGLGPIAYADRGALEYQAVKGGGIGPVTASVAGARPAGLSLRVMPNPVRTSASIAFQLERPAMVNVRIFDLSGRLVRSFPPAFMGSPGQNSVALDGREGSLAPGVYMVEIRAGAQRTVGRFVVMR